MNREHQRQARPDRFRPDLRWTRGLFRTHRSHLGPDHRLNRLRSLLLQAPAKIASQPRRHRILWIWSGMPYLLRSSLRRRNAATAMAVLSVRLHRRCASALPPHSARASATMRRGAAPPTPTRPRPPSRCATSPTTSRLPPHKPPARWLRAMCSPASKHMHLEAALLMHLLLPWMPPRQPPYCRRRRRRRSSVASGRAPRQQLPPHGCGAPPPRSQTLQSTTSRFSCHPRLPRRRRERCCRPPPCRGLQPRRRREVASLPVAHSMSAYMSTELSCRLLRLRLKRCEQGSCPPMPPSRRARLVLGPPVALVKSLRARHIYLGACATR